MSAFRDQFEARLRTLNQEQAASLVRTAVQVISGATGWVWMNDNAFISGASFLVMALVTLWGVWASSDKNLIASAANVPAVARIETKTGDVAEAVPSSKVVAAMGAPSSFAALLLLFLIVPFLAGCAQGLANVPVTPGVTRPTVVETRIAGYDAQVRSYCTALQFATGLGEWFAETEQHKLYIHRAKIVVHDYCEQPIVDVRSALSFLATAYEDIMRVPAVKVQVTNAKLTVTQRRK